MSSVAILESPLFVAPDVWSRCLAPVDVAPHARLVDHTPVRRGTLMAQLRRGDQPFPQQAAFCAFLGAPSQRVIPHRRIGSPSSEAEVYLVQYGSALAALKLLPILTDADVQKNEREIEYALRASNLVLQRGASTHFPLVYAHGHCDSVAFFRNGSIASGAVQYACMDALRQANPAQERQITRLFRARQSPEQIAARLQLDASVCIDAPVHAQFLLSELANEDLLHWSTRRQSVLHWRCLVQQVLDAVRVLHRDEQISHSDLHLGNVLLLADYAPDSVTALLHDFGRAEPLDEHNWRDDLLRFFYALEQVDNTLGQQQVPPAVQRFATDAQHYVERYRGAPDADALYDALSAMLDAVR